MTRRHWHAMTLSEFDAGAPAGQQLALMPTPDLFGTPDLFAELEAEQLGDVERREIPEYLRPRPLSNGEMDWCASTRNGTRCAWVRHFGNSHSYDPPETMPDWLDQ
jgi:hypothetical protein